MGVLSLMGGTVCGSAELESGAVLFLGLLSLRGGGSVCESADI